MLLPTFLASISKAATTSISEGEYPQYPQCINLLLHQDFSIIIMYSLNKELAQFPIPTIAILILFTITPAPIFN